jgi:TonB family protein
VFNFLSLTLVLFAHFAFQAQRRTCDHAAPPAGMHYVCAQGDSCNCHLEEDQPDRDGSGGTSSRIPRVEPCVSSSVKYFVVPAYPEAARRARKQGVVTARLAVLASGVAEVSIESGDPVFAELVVEALKKWKFAPTGPPQEITATVAFMLTGNPTKEAVTTVSGSSPLDLVITATPPPR